jgi:hypothetical protein
VLEWILGDHGTGEAPAGGALQFLDPVLADDVTAISAGP